jgi:hypothetical protein
MIHSGDIPSVARWLVLQMAAHGYERDEVVELVTALLEELSLKHRPGTPP